MRVVETGTSASCRHPGLMSTRWASKAHWGAAIAMVTVLTLFTPAFGDTAALASFPSSPRLDTFRTDDLLNPSWTTPALGENGMYLDGTAHEFTGSVTPGNAWAAALWNNSPTHEAFSTNVEAWATISRASRGDAFLYADVAGGASGATHAWGGYFAQFADPHLPSSPAEVSIHRIDTMSTESKLAFVSSPYRALRAGDRIGLSFNHGVIIAWYKPRGGAWTAAVSTVDHTYTTGGIAIEEIPGTAYGFSEFGGGTPSRPVNSTMTATSMAASTPSSVVGQQVTYTATVTPTPTTARRGTVAFSDGTGESPRCGRQPLNASGKATCVVTYNRLGTHNVAGLYTGSPNGAFAGSTNNRDATISVVPVLSKLPGLRVQSRHLIATVACPRGSGRCVVVDAAVAIVAKDDRLAVIRKKHSRIVNAGHATQLMFAVTGTAHSKLRSYIHRHRHPVVSVTLHLVVRDAAGTSGTFAFPYTISSPSALAQL